ncbi:MAG: BCCT family transporter [Gammaproteobacteria bacterium]|nr:BCCT family transporter [Gammaproteobacteria bacterium]
MLDLDPVVFGASATLIAVFLVVSLIFLHRLESAVDALQAWIANRTGWFLVLTVNVVLGYLVVLMCSRFGAIRLGGREARPDFSTPAWFAMLFSAGMGIGLMFYAVAEPLYHLLTSPHGAAAGTPAAYEDAIRTTFLHWGLHAWGIYALTGLALAYFSFNLNQPLSIRALFYPLLGERIHGPLGAAVDTLACIATLFGVATSLGLGVAQINAGLAHLFGWPVSAPVQIALIAGITLIATISVVSGLNHGIRRLSEFNLAVAGLLLLLVLLAGPTLFILNGLPENIGLYLNDFFALGFWNETYTQGHWQNGWTVFYWGWWCAWAPFVGMFIARISRGRTIREYLLGVLLVSTGLTFAWLSVFGDAALYIELHGDVSLGEAVQQDVARSLYLFLERLPQAGGLGPWLSQVLPVALGLLATLATVSFFVTSSDSGSLVIDIISAGGKPNPPVLQRIFWAVTEGVVAAVLLVGGGLTALQTAAISVGLPFSVMLMLLIVSLHKALLRDPPVI